MSRSYSRLASGIVALVAAAGSAVALAGTAVASPAAVAQPLTIYKMVQCPPGYVLNPQNTQQCVPMNDPYGGTSVSPGG